MMDALEKGGIFALAWAQLTPRDHLALGLGLTEPNAAPEDQALAAFFLFDADEPDRAQTQPARAEDRGKETLTISREQACAIRWIVAWCVSPACADNPEDCLAAS